MRMTICRFTIAGFIAVLLVGCTSSFEKLDDDSSGRLSKSETGREVLNFDFYDRNNDGELDRYEYEQAYRAIQSRRNVDRSASRSSRSSGRGS